MDYSTAHTSWGAGPAVRIFMPDNIERLARSPLQFLRQGKVDNWGYILYAVGQLLELAPGQQGGFYLRGDETPIALDEPVTEGIYVFRLSPGKAFPLARDGYT